MGLFGKSKEVQEIQYFTCTSCGKMVTEDNFNNEMHMCHTCAMVTASFKESFMSIQIYSILNLQSKCTLVYPILYVSLIYFSKC